MKYDDEYIRIFVLCFQCWNTKSEIWDTFVITWLQRSRMMMMPAPHNCHKSRISDFGNIHKKYYCHRLILCWMDILLIYSWLNRYGHGIACFTILESWSSKNEMSQLDAGICMKPVILHTGKPCIYIYWEVLPHLKIKNMYNKRFCVLKLLQHWNSHVWFAVVLYRSSRGTKN